MCVAMYSDGLGICTFEIGGDRIEGDMECNFIGIWSLFWRKCNIRIVVSRNGIYLCDGRKEDTEVVFNLVAGLHITYDFYAGYYVGYGACDS